MKKSTKENINQIWLPIVAIIISIVGFAISVRSCSIADKSYDISLTPILEVKFVTGQKTRLCLSLLNDGPSSIYKIRIKVLYRTISRNYTLLSELSSKGLWDSVDVLQQENSVSFPIDSNMINTIHRIQIEDENTKYANGLYPYASGITFLISYRREPDKKIYRIEKNLIFFQDSNTGQPFAIDHDEFPFPTGWIHDAVKKLDSLDRDYGPFKLIIQSCCLTSLKRKESSR